MSDPVLPGGDRSSEPSAEADPELRPWSPPRLEELPPLTDLTLQTGSAIGGSGDTSGGGSTVF